MTTTTKASRAVSVAVPEQTALSPAEMRQQAAQAVDRARRLDRQADTEFAAASRLIALAELSEERAQIEAKRSAAQADVEAAEAGREAANERLQAVMARHRDAVEVLDDARAAVQRVEAGQATAKELLAARRDVEIAAGMEAEAAEPVTAARHEVDQARMALRLHEDTLADLDAQLAEVDRRLESPDPLPRSAEALKTRLWRDWPTRLVEQGEADARQFSEAEWEIVHTWARMCISLIPSNIGLQQSRERTR